LKAAWYLKEGNRTKERIQVQRINEEESKEKRESE
jgi:hypothetical protein